MAKVTGPLLSIAARGSIASTQVYSTWKGIDYVRQHVIPANPNTAAQQTTRGVFKEASDLWLRAPTLIRAPWDRNAVGRPYTGRNKFIGSYIGALRGDADMADLIMSPGAKGGPAALAVVAVGGALLITVTITEPALPTGWTITQAVAGAIEDGAPGALTDLNFTVLNDVATPFSIVLTGLTAATTYAVGGWIEWLKPDGSTAYSVSEVALEATD